ncbi:MAG: NfeD family protein [Microcoleaceae cyanobacterium MO_207.B10]|nr:NfeD family protein [Microcoleaceae cyanobacterium MO_207.B10]
MLNAAFKTANTNNPYLLSISREAIVDETILPNQVGRIRYRGSVWNAKCLQEVAINPGEVVYVVGNDGITLIVDSLSNSENIYPGQNQKKLSPVAPLFLLGNFLLILLILL